MTTRTYGAKDSGGFYFQSDSAQSNSARRAEKAKGNAGTPLRLNAKLSAVLRDTKEGGVVFVADNGGGVRRVDCKTNKTIHTYRGPRQPVTSICTDPSGTILFAGCWDKTIWSWDVSTGAQQKRYVGHTDFVNCITTCHVNTHIDSASQYNECLLISGSVDATIIVWRVESGERLHTLKGHSRGILDLAIDPLSPLVNESRSLPEAIFVLSASSTPEIRSWRVSLASASEITTTLTVAAESDEHAEEDAEDTVVHATDSAPFSLHDTSVNRILFSPSSPSSGPAEYDLYTASSDNTSKILARPKPQNSTNGISSTRSDVPSPTTAPPPQWTTTSTFTHPDWVRAIAHDPASGILVTACRDEEVRVWDTNEGECIKVLTGHFDSVEGVTFVDLASKDGVEEKWIVSVSLDGTLRRWKLKGEVAEDDVARQDKAEEEPEVGDSAAKAKVVTTEDEDRELAELMAELEDDD